MKKIMCRVKSFITFDFPLQADFIKAEFDAVHSKNLVEVPDWNTTATRQKLISNYSKSQSKKVKLSLQYRYFITTLIFKRTKVNSFS